MDESEEQLLEELRTKRICRFCLTQEEPLSDIYSEADVNSKTKSTPLTLCIMACVSIEVYKEDGMPSTICECCRQLLDHSYNFKQICKKADTLLKTYPLTGVWPEKLQVPMNLFKPNASKPVEPKIAAQPPQKQPVPQLKGYSLAKRIPQIPEKAPEISMRRKSVHIRQASPVKNDKLSSNITEITHEIMLDEEDIKPKIVKLSIDDLRKIKQGKPIGRTELLKKPSDEREVVAQTSSAPQKSYTKTALAPKTPVKVINGTLNKKPPIILNSMKPSVKTEEHFVHTADGTLEIVTTEAPELDPIKNAPLVDTDVYPCTECERSFPLRQLLDIHMKNHNRERNHPCELCDKRFFSKYDLAKHNLTHTGERPYICVICKSAFSRSTLLTRHQKIHKDQAKYRCMFCERSFLSEDELQKHAVCHQKKRPFQCTKCSKSFTYKQGLERHEVTHETNLPFQCDHCDVSFSTPAKLARHLTAHAGSRPYPCRMCSRSFMMSHHLTRHVRSHQGGRGAYKCNDCSKIFYSQDELIYHSAVHATESKTCPLCREHFETLELVTEHIREHSEGIQYACDYCDLLFTSEQRLDQHCQDEHASVLSLDRRNSEVVVSDELSEGGQQFIIEEIAINTDGSKMITTFIDGEEKNKKFVQKPKGKTIKRETNEGDDHEIMMAEDDSQDPFDDSSVGDDHEDDDDYTPPASVTKAQPKSKSKESEVTQKVTSIKPPPPTVKSPPAVKSPQAVKPSPVVKSPPAEPASAQKSNQQKLESFFKKIPGKQPTTTTAAKSVGDVLKNLPKGMVVKRPAPPAQTNVEKTASTTANAKPQKSNESTQQTKDTGKAQETVPPAKPKPTAATVSPVKSSARLGAKRRLEESKSPSPTKRIAVDPKKDAESPGATSSKPIAKPAPKTNTSALNSAKKSKTFEMKIGDKIVKVQKVVMTKAEVAAMARDGKIEMQGDVRILKQPKQKN